MLQSVANVGASHGMGASHGTVRVIYRGGAPVERRPMLSRTLRDGHGMRLQGESQVRVHDARAEERAQVRTGPGGTQT